MMNGIYGIGTDLVKVSRIEEAFLKHGDRFISRIMSPRDFKLYPEVTPNRLAKIFCVKEAVSKALGTGISAEVGFQSISLDHDERGKPLIELDPAVIRTFPIGAIHVSLTDEDDYIQAFVVIERR